MGRIIKLLLIKIRDALFGIPPNTDLITNIHQAKEAHRTAPPFYCRKIANQWDNFIFIELKNEQTIGQITKTYLHSRGTSQAEKAAFEKGNILLLKLISESSTVAEVIKTSDDGCLFLNKRTKEIISQKKEELQKK